MIQQQGQGIYDSQQLRRIVAQPKPVTKRKQSFIPTDVFRRTLHGYDQNMFVQNLLSGVPYPFERDNLEKIISQYYLGTITKGYRAGGTTFPFIDKLGNVRTVQVKQFDTHNHTVGTDFLHSILERHYEKKWVSAPDWLRDYLDNEKKVTCLFGEHLLSRYPHNPIALVEAPKTAVYGTLYFGFPDDHTKLLWLAVYNLSSLNYDKCKALAGRDVYLFPDLSKDGRAYELWSEKANQLKEQLPGTRFEVSDLLERNATEAERTNGLDLADYLIRLDWRSFKKEGCFSTTQTTLLHQTDLPSGHTLKTLTLPWGKVTNQINEHGYPAFWDN